MYGLDEIIAMNGNSEEDLDRGNAFDVVGPQPGDHPLNKLRLACSVNVAPSLDNVREYVAREINSFEEVRSQHQRGYLAALLAVAKEGLREDVEAAPYAHGEALLNGPRREGEAAVAALIADTRAEARVAVPFDAGFCPDGTKAWGPWSNWPRECANH